MSDDFAAVSAQQREDRAAVHWLPDSSSSCCIICGAEFTRLARRHHCRFCGLLCCARCSDNSAVVGQSIERICDACAAIIVPPTPARRTDGLDAWAERRAAGGERERGARAGFAFFFALLNDQRADVHENAARALWRLFPEHARQMVGAGAQCALEHARRCSCTAQALSLELYVSMLLASADIGSEQSAAAAVEALANESLCVRRAGARLACALASRGALSAVPELAPALEECTGDRWAVAHLLAAAAEMDSAMEVLPAAVRQFGAHAEGATVASKYFASVVLERETRSGDTAELIKCDFGCVADGVVALAPASSGDNRAECIIADNLLKAILNMWLRFSGTVEQGIRLLSSVHMAVCDVLCRENGGVEDSKLSEMQMCCFRIIKTIAPIDKTLMIMLKSQQMIDTLGMYSNGSSSFCEMAKEALSELEKE